MPRYSYAGRPGQPFPQYLDTAKGSTLVAEPGQTYDIEPAAGQTVPDGKGGLTEMTLAMPPNDDFKPAKASAQQNRES